MSNILKTLAAGNAAAGDYEISRSLRFNSADSAYLSRTPASAGNRKTWTYSVWVKKTRIIGAGNRMGLLGVGAQASGNFVFGFANNVSGPTGDEILVDRSGFAGPVSTAVYRDVSGWYHIVIAVDTTLASNRIKVYVNGSQLTIANLDNVYGQNVDTGVNSTSEHRIGQFYQNAEYFDGYLADAYLIDGQALTPSSFGETDAVTGVWKPKEYAGTYGTNGFHLDFSDNTSTTTLGYDAAGSNDWTLNNFSVTAGAGNDSLVDSPTRYDTDTGAGGEVRGNYCTLNPLYKFPSTGVTLSNGNLNVASVLNTTGLAHGTIGVTSGKYYFEMLVGTVSSTDSHFAGWQIETPAAVVRGAYRSDGTIYDFAGSTTSGSTYTTNDIIGCAVDVTSGKVWFAKNNTWQNSGDPAAGTNEAFTFTAGTEVFPFIAFDNKSVALDAVANFGQRPFAYTAPSGFKALCTTNLPEGTITTSGTFTGNGSADGPFVYLNGVPTAMTIDGNAVTFGTHADKLSNGFKVRSSSASYNANATSMTYSVSTTGAKFKFALAQPNP